MDPEVPLVVPEVNPQAALEHRGIIANPNCSTIQAVAAIYPLHLAAGLEYVHYVSFQAVSGTGTAALDELDRGSRAALDGDPFEPSVYPHPIAFNVLPHIGSFDEEGHTEEEWKMVNESRKIMAIPDLRVSCTTTRVPVFKGHSESITAQFGRELSVEEARGILTAAPGVVLVDDPQRDVYPLAADAADRDPVFVGRVRKDLGLDRALTLWVVADNIRKGAALNAVQIAETLLSEGCIG
jgi:aspartate-semialdehyde dehydrogenase